MDDVQSSWLDQAGAEWVDGRASSPLGPHLDVTDLALDLVNFCAETQALQAADTGGEVDRKPHLQRMSVDFGSKRHDKSGRRLATMLTGEGPGARSLRRWWELLDNAVTATCRQSKLIQMFPIVATGVGPAATTGEPHVDMIQDRETHIPIGARGTIHLTAGGSGAEREFRVAPVELTKVGVSQAGNALRLADHCLQV